jgi:putative hemolysin
MVQKQITRGTSRTLGRLGSLSTRLAVSDEEIREAQKIRFEVFCGEFFARQQTDPSSRVEQEDHDKWCDHLLVLDTANEASPKTVGTQRFLVKKASDKTPVFRSQSEFDLEGLAVRHPDKTFMELGRSCILEAYRSKRTMELMWHGTWAYAIENSVDVMTGCASFHAQSIEDIKPALNFLASLSVPDTPWKVDPVSDDCLSIQQLLLEDDIAIEPKKAIRTLPPLIKGYLRLGAVFSDHVVFDKAFGTIDIAVILPVENINPRYVNYYGADASKHDKPLSSASSEG